MKNFLQNALEQYIVYVISYNQVRDTRARLLLRGLFSINKSVEEGVLQMR